MTNARSARSARWAASAALFALMLGVAGCSGGSSANSADTLASPLSVPHAPRTVPQTGPAAHGPNILVIESDDMRTDELRWMPNVRRLIADRGLTYQNSFAPYPLCCPSRSSFLTGEYAHNHGVLNHTPPFGFHAFKDHLTLATQLQGRGYDTAIVGKYLNGYGQQAVHGTHASSLLYVPPGWTSWQVGSDHLWKPGQVFQGQVRHGSTYAYFDLTQNVDGHLANSKGQYNTDVLAGQTRQLIRRFGKVHKPWFIWFTPIAPHFGSPHEPDDPARTFSTPHRHVTVWKTPGRPAWVKGLFNAEITHGLGVPLHHQAEADISDKPRFLRVLDPLNAAEKAAETNLARQRAEALYVLDRQVGKTIAELRRTGQYANTVIAFTSDNGYYLGEHRKRQGKIELHEPSLRVPFLIAGPGIPHGLRYDPITTVDMAPTFSAIAGIGPMPKADGINMLPNMIHGDTGWIRPVVTEAMMSSYPAPNYDTSDGFDSALNARGLRLGRWKLTEYVTGESELYDLLKDPLELRSLSGDPAYAAVLKEMQLLWRHYENCREAACSAPLPKKWQLSVAQEQRLTEQQVRQVAAYYNDPALATGPLPQ